MNSPATMLLSRPIRGLLPQMSREPINVNNDNAQYKTLEDHQKIYIMDINTQKDHSVLFFLARSTVALQ